MYEGEYESKAIISTQFDKLLLSTLLLQVFLSGVFLVLPYPHIGNFDKTNKNPHSQYCNRFCLLSNTLFVIKTTKTTEKQSLCFVLLTRSAPCSRSKDNSLHQNYPGLSCRIRIWDPLADSVILPHLAFSVFAEQIPFLIPNDELCKCDWSAFWIAMVWACSFCQLICT